MIKTVIENKRGCGYRKPGGLYLIGGASFQHCGMLPIPLSVCPCCNQGIKPIRGFGWISPEIWKGKKCSDSDCKHCAPFFDPPEKVGIMWVGSKFYPAPDDFVEESVKMGTSKRIAQIPKDLVVGQTWVMLAHREPEPHIFSCFIPTEIQYVVKGTETTEEIEALEKRGITCVKVVNPDYKEPKKTPDNQLKMFEEQKDDSVAASCGNCGKIFELNRMVNMADLNQMWCLQCVQQRKEVIHDLG